MLDVDLTSTVLAHHPSRARQRQKRGAATAARRRAGGRLQRPPRSILRLQTWMVAPQGSVANPRRASAAIPGRRANSRSVFGSTARPDPDASRRRRAHRRRHRGGPMERRPSRAYGGTLRVDTPGRRAGETQRRRGLRHRCLMALRCRIERRGDGALRHVRDILLAVGGVACSKRNGLGTRARIRRRDVAGARGTPRRSLRGGHLRARARARAPTAALVGRPWRRSGESQAFWKSKSARAPQ